MSDKEDNVFSLIPVDDNKEDAELKKDNRDYFLFKDEESYSEFENILREKIGDVKNIKHLVCLFSLENDGEQSCVMTVQSGNNDLEKVSGLLDSVKFKLMCNMWLGV